MPDYHVWTRIHQQQREVEEETEHIPHGGTISLVLSHRPVNRDVE